MAVAEIIQRELMEADILAQRQPVTRERPNNSGSQAEDLNQNKSHRTAQHEQDKASAQF